MAAVGCMAILVAKMVPRLATVPWFLKWIHFGLVGIFSLIAIRGPHFALLFCLKHERFVDIFSQPNVLGVGPILMEWLALIFAVAGTVFYVTVMMLGNFSRRARTAFIYLAFPCGILYPIVMLCAFTGAGSSHPAVFLAYGAAFVFVALAGFATMFYTSNFVTSQIEFK